MESLLCTKRWRIWQSGVFVRRLEAVVELLGVQVQRNAHPDQGVPGALQQEHEVGVHRPDPPVPGQHPVHHRVADVHHNGVHAALGEGVARPVPRLADVDEVVEQRQDDQSQADSHADEGQRPEVLVHGDGATLPREAAQGAANQTQDHGQDEPATDPRLPGGMNQQGNTSKGTQEHLHHAQDAACKKDNQIWTEIAEL